MGSITLVVRAYVRGSKLHSLDIQITNEEVSPGAFPLWLYNHIISEISEPLPYSKGGPSKLLIIYPNSESRDETLSRLSKDGFVIDRNLHHTISSLMISIMNDYRMPKLLEKTPYLDLIIHEECVAESAKLGFPLINPLPTMFWDRGKTKALLKLHKFLSSESIDTSNWEGPGIQTINKVLKSLEIKMNFTHPDFLVNRLIYNLNDSTHPFSLTDVDGIIMLNHSPITPKIHLDFMSVLSQHCPIHQLANSGNFRKGEHGMLLFDQYPITEESQLPLWVPKHKPVNEITPQLNKMRRILIQDENQSFSAALSFASEELSSNPDSRIIIVDPAYHNNISEWNVGLKNLGIPVNHESVKIRNHPLGYWINFYLNLGHDSDSFSLLKLRALSLQDSINLFPDVGEHPFFDDLSPIPDIDTLNRVSLENHILGGPGALERWIVNLSRTSKEIDKDLKSLELERIKKQEQTLWWLLCLSQWLYPILSNYDQQILDQNKVLTGFFSEQILPLPNRLETGDEWMLETLQLSREKSGIEELDGQSDSSAGVIQSILFELNRFRTTQKLVNQKNTSEWVEEICNLMDNIETYSSPNKISSRLRILSTEKVLGCTSELIILANISSQSWNLKVPKMTFLDDEEKNKYNLLRADSPVRNARHLREHIFSCATEVIILDPSEDESTPAAAPISEWILENDCTDISETFDLEQSILPIPRLLRQKDGKLLEKSELPVLPPINADAVTISYEINLQRDRESRQPKMATDDGYLSDLSKRQLFQFQTSLLWKNKPKKFPEGTHWPRKNLRWPVYSGTQQWNGKAFITPTIDPRPFNPEPTGILVTDRRNGYQFGTKLEPIIWSPSKLYDWLICPRQGWLKHGIKAGIEESSFDEGFDNRIHGNLFHQLHHNLLCEVLDFEIGSVRELNIDSNIPKNLSNCGLDDELLMEKVLHHLDNLAPWLTRTDSESKNRLRMLSGLSTIEWESWIADPKPIPLTGRLGEMILAEKSSLINSIPIAIEWKFDKVNLTLPKELTIPSGQKLPPIKIKGSIDRVDIVPFIVDDKKIWINEKGDDTTAPLELYNSEWKPRRLVIIRDLKTSEKTKPNDLMNRHKKGVLQELQLALYARAWEEQNPGDLVVGVGISTLGQKTTHFVELSNTEYIQNLENIGKDTKVTHTNYRFINETSEPKSDPFRAWLASRISTALSISNNSQNGYFHPIPQKNCKYCKVQKICDVRMEGLF